MVKANAKLWLEHKGQFVLGKGRAELLRRIDETGSLAKAAREMKMSYSHAWSEVRNTSIAAGEPVVETIRGGEHGGGTHLTKWGKSLLERFEEEQASLEKHLAGRNKR